MSEHINKYFREIVTDDVSPVDILNIFGVDNKHLKESFINIVVACNPKYNISNIIELKMDPFKYINGYYIDVYDVLDNFNIINPSLQHATKKILMAGLRGHKPLETDLFEIISALSRAAALKG